ncbi:MAG: hypothetical protein ABFE07_29090 [Armatimonadia bacterium]
MELRDFAHEMLKAAGKGSLAGRAWRWFTTSRVRPGFSAKGHPETARQIMSSAGKSMSRDERMNLQYIAAGKAHDRARKVLKDAAKRHDVRKLSLTKPLVAGGAALGAAAGVRSGRSKSRPLAMVDRSPQLVQDPSKVVY